VHVRRGLPKVPQPAKPKRTVGSFATRVTFELAFRLEIPCRTSEPPSTLPSRSSQESFPIGSQLESKLRAEECENPSFAKFFKMGIRLVFTYQTIDKAEVVQVHLDPKDCGH
jgi:hypothetical protein